MRCWLRGVCRLCGHCVNNIIGNDGDYMDNLVFWWVYLMHVDGDEDQFVFRVHVADYVDLKAAWHPRLLAGAPEVRASRWIGHGLPWCARFLARCAAAASCVALLSLQR